MAIATFERSADTSLVVADGDTVVIGGLVQDKSQETISKVPILGDIPILGWLFRSKSSETSKTNLMIFITPQIVRKYEKMRAILDQKLKQRDDFLRKNNGGEDPFREARDDMIRSLPEMQAIQSYHYENNLPALESESNEADKSKENKK